MDSLNVTKCRNSVDASEKNPVMRRKEEKKMIQNISEVMSKEDILSVAKRNKRGVRMKAALLISV